MVRENIIKKVSEYSVSVCAWLGADICVYDYGCVWNECRKFRKHKMITDKTVN
jgi:hypothetical protein